MQSYANNRYKTTLCKHFQVSQQCPVGTRCHFAHGQKDLRSMMDPLPQAAMINPIEPNQSLLQGSLGVNYKTSKCRNYEMGSCKYGPACHFAHGDIDLRQPDYTSLQLQNQAIQMQQMQHKITLYQLQYILYQIQQSNPKDPIIVQKLKVATELWTASNISSCGSMINEIVFNESYTEEQKNFYQNIVKEAQKLADQYLNQVQQQGNPQ